MTSTTPPGSPPRTEGSSQSEHAIKVNLSCTTLSQDDLKSPCTPSNFPIEPVQAGQKHPRDHNDGNTSPGTPKRTGGISFGRSLILQDLAHTSSDSLRESDNSGDLSFSSSQDLYQSTSKLYTWNYLDGSGQLDSDVDTVWSYNGVNISHDLMEFRRRVIENNGGLSSPHQKLLVVDEAQILGDKDIDKLESFYAVGEPRPMLSPILHGFRNPAGSNDITIIYCGTNLSNRTLHWGMCSGNGVKE
ncbi:hypothetical protein BGZ76_004806, partial [Entomortierella beljakovae]